MKVPLLASRCGIGATGNSPASSAYPSRSSPVASGTHFRRASICLVRAGCSAPRRRSRGCRSHRYSRSVPWCKACHRSTNRRRPAPSRRLRRSPHDRSISAQRSSRASGVSALMPTRRARDLRARSRPNFGGVPAGVARILAAPSCPGKTRPENSAAWHRAVPGTPTRCVNAMFTVLCGLLIPALAGGYVRDDLAYEIPAFLRALQVPTTGTGRTESCSRAVRILVYRRRSI